MLKSKVDIIIPVFNELKNILILFKLFEKNIKSKVNILICFDRYNDNVYTNRFLLKKFKLNYKFVKNNKKGPCEAIKKGFAASKGDCVIVYPADDFLNTKLIDIMVKKFQAGSHIVAPSRFMMGGSMKNCPLIKSIFVRFCSLTLFFFSSIPIQDASNGFRLFSKKLLNQIDVESKLGFAYALEILVKCERLNLKITQIPAQWEERKHGKSRFATFKWLRQYLRWYLYGLATTWLLKKNEN